MREKRIIEWASWVCVLNGDLSLLFKVLYRSVVVVKQVETCTTVIWKSPGAAMCWLEGRQRLPRSAEPWELPLATTFHKVAGRWSLLSMVGVPHSLCRLSNFMSLWSIWQPGAPEGSVQKYYIFSTYFHWLAAFWNARTLILFYESTTLFTSETSSISLKVDELIFTIFVCGFHVILDTYLLRWHMWLVGVVLLSTLCVFSS